MVLTARGQYVQAMAVLTAARTAQMVDTCEVTRPSSRPSTPVLDDDGDIVAAAGAPVYTGVCTLSAPSRQPENADAVTDASGVPNVRVLKVPHAVDLRAGDIITITAAPFSPGLVGDRFVVLGEEERTYATCRLYALRGSSWLSE